jgi:hypothetical protein
MAHAVMGEQTPGMTTKSVERQAILISHDEENIHAKNGRETEAMENMDIHRNGSW